MNRTMALMFVTASAILAALVCVSPQPPTLQRPKDEVKERGVVYFDAPIDNVRTYWR
jgi:hypothetical protein